MALSNGNPALAGYTPMKYAPQLLRKWYADTLLSRIMNRDYEGELKKSGKQITIRQRPSITIQHDVVKGAPVDYPYLMTEEKVIDIDRNVFWTFGVDHVDKAESDLKTFTNDWLDEAKNRQREGVEKVILNTSPGNAITANQGATAGAQSAAFNLGTVAAPLHLTELTSYTDAGSIVRQNAADLLADFVTVLRESNVPMNLAKWAVLPPWVTNRIAKSAVKDASVTGDGKGVIRSGPDYVGNVNGIQIYESTLFESTLGGLNTAEAVWPILFGVNDGWTFAATIEFIESFILQTKVGTGFRGQMNYGFDTLIDGGLGVAYAVTT